MTISQALSTQWHALGERLVLQMVIELPSLMTALQLEMLLTSSTLHDPPKWKPLPDARIVRQLIEKGYLAETPIGSPEDGGYLIVTAVGWLYLKGMPAAQPLSASEPASSLSSQQAVTVSTDSVDQPNERVVVSRRQDIPVDPQSVQPTALSGLMVDKRLSQTAAGTTQVFSVPAMTQAQELLFSELKTLRGYWAKRQGLAPYCICRTQSLYEMATKHPTDEGQLQDVFGIGKSFVEKYGSAFLEVLAQHALYPHSKLSTFKEQAAHGS